MQGCLREGEREKEVDEERVGTRKSRKSGEEQEREQGMEPQLVGREGGHRPAAR